MDEALWQQFAITEEVWLRFKERREKLSFDFSWLPKVLLATFDDCIPRWDLIPKSEKESVLSVIFSLQYSVHVSDAVSIVRQGGLSGSPDRFDSFLRQKGLLVIPTRPFCNPNDGPLAFGFDIGDMLERFKLYGVDILQGHDRPLIRLMLSMRDLSDSFVEIDCSHYGHPILRLSALGGLILLAGCQYEFLLEGDVPLSLCGELNVDPHNNLPCSLYGAACPEKDQDANVVRILALAITSTNVDCIRLLKRDSTLFGLNYLTSFRLWLKNLDLQFTGNELRQEMLHDAFVELANGNFDLAVEKLKTSSLSAVFDFVADRVVNLFGFSPEAVGLYLLSC